MSQFQSQSLQLATPLTWRKNSPLHKQLGARATRYSYSSGVTAGETGTLQFRYDASTALDRVIGMCLSIAAPTGIGGGACDFTITEANTGWTFSASYSGVGGLYAKVNVETYPDEAFLNWNFNVALPTNAVYLSFFNVEVVECLLK